MTTRLNAKHVLDTVTINIYSYELVTHTGSQLCTSHIINPRRPDVQRPRAGCTAPARPYVSIFVYSVPSCWNIGGHNLTKVIFQQNPSTLQQFGADGAVEAIRGRQLITRACVERDDRRRSRSVGY
jgi:hypothetical protein